SAGRGRIVRRGGRCAVRAPQRTIAGGTGSGESGRAQLLHAAEPGRRTFADHLAASNPTAAGRSCRRSSGPTARAGSRGLSRRHASKSSAATPVRLEPRIPGAHKEREPHSGAGGGTERNECTYIFYRPQEGPATGVRVSGEGARFICCVSAW